ncbi:MAG: PDZ domain-containing protein [Gemmataceae bacterium]|nr:PDZ domain-containing protein [Gemmataceae bacterium]
MTHTLRRGRLPLLGLLAVTLVAVPSPAAEPAPAPRPVGAAADVPPDKVAELEKQIAELQKQIAELKKGQAAPAAKPAGPTAAEGAIPDDWVKKMTWRAIGPANMGGRVTALAVVESDPSTYYVATASGGLLKTVNNGTTFSHLFDKQATVSIGDVAVAPSDPNVLYVGTGENNPRNSVTYGDGVYKSTDAGKTWKNVGLNKTYSIGKVVVHPKDPNTVYVGAMGRVYGPNEDRGLFKTTDGGKTWNKVLYVDDKTGVIDFRMDPSDPETLIVGLWGRQRDEFDGFFGPLGSWPTMDQYGPATSYGPGGGLQKTSDGGKTWKKLTAGLPATAKTGRIGLDYSRKTKGLVYAIIDTENVGKGRPPLTVFVGLSSEDEKGGGIKVTLAPEDAPAGKAGVKEGDVVTAIDGKPVENYETFYALIVPKKPGDVARFTLKRGGQEETVEVKLAAREEPKKDPEAKGGGPARKGGGGGRTAKMDPEAKTDPPAKTGPAAKKEGTTDNPQAKEGGPKTPAAPPAGLGVRLEAGEGGLTITGVPEGSPAAEAGVKEGDQLVVVAGKKVVDAEAVRVALADLKPGDKAKITVNRAGKPVEIELTLAQGRGGRAGPANPNRPYLLSSATGGQQPNVQNSQGKDGVETGGVFKSTDNGETWARVNSLNPRPFYFSQIRVDPSDDKTVYVLGDTNLWKSTDGGARFAGGPSRGVHADHHALWIDPKDGRHMVIGCDGGFYATYDRGQNWDHLNVLGLGQFYHVAVDGRKPYRVYGGLQDNGSWGGPSHVLRSSGPVNDDWVYVNGGDGFVCRVDPSDPDLVYSESQNGAMGRRNLRTGERGFIRPRPVKEGEELRFNWNTPFILSNHNPSIFYCAAQYVFRSVSKGDNLKPISPEITRTKQGSGTAVAESPRNPDVLWAGTDDGYLWVSKDGGAKWENVSVKLTAAGPPGPRWVAAIEPSRAKDGRCYVCLDGHRSDDDKPYLFVTEDFGQTWQPVTANLPAFGSTRVIREDYTNPEILYVGTEFGAWVTVNRGKGWARLNNNLPTVAVHEFAQPTTAGEIVAATHGRSLWVLDVAALRQMAPRTEKAADGEKTVDALKEPVTLFAPAPAVRWKVGAGGESPYSATVRKFYGTNPDRRAALEYALTKPAKELSLKVVDVTGQTVRTFGNAPKEAGFHRQAWDLTRAGGGPGGQGRGPGGGGLASVVPAGSYRLVLTVDGKEYSQPVVVENDPNADPKAVITAGGDFVPGEEDGDGEMEDGDEPPAVEE